MKITINLTNQISRNQFKYQKILINRDDWFLCFECTDIFTANLASKIEISAKKVRKVNNCKVVKS